MHILGHSVSIPGNSAGLGLNACRDDTSSVNFCNFTKVEIDECPGS